VTEFESYFWRTKDRWWFGWVDVRAEIL